MEAKFFRRNFEPFATHRHRAYAQTDLSTSQWTKTHIYSLLMFCYFLIFMKTFIVGTHWKHLTERHTNKLGVK